MSVLIGIACDGENCTEKLVLEQLERGSRPDRVHPHHIRDFLSDKGWVQCGPEDYCPKCWARKKEK